MVAKKDPKDKFKRITFTASPVLEKKVIEKAKAENRPLSGVIVELLEKWLSDEPIHTDITNTNLSLPSPPTVDILEELKRDILEELKREISTEREKKETLEPVQSTLVHTDITDMNQSIEAPTSPDNDVTHTNIPPKEETSIPVECEDVKIKITPSMRDEITSHIIEMEKTMSLSEMARLTGITHQKLSALKKDETHEKSPKTILKSDYDKIMSLSI